MLVSGLVLTASMGKSERPEHTAPPEIFYNSEEARKYTTNSRIMQIQVVDLSFLYLRTYSLVDDYLIGNWV